MSEPTAAVPVPEVGDDERIIVPAVLPAGTFTGTTPVIVPANAGVPTQVANPSRASWRTWVQSLIGFLVVLNAAAFVLLPFVLDPANGLEAALGPVYGWVVLILNGITFVGATLSKLIALLMANPIVNAFISRHLSWLAPIKPAEQ